MSLGKLVRLHDMIKRWSRRAIGKSVYFRLWFSSVWGHWFIFMWMRQRSSLYSGAFVWPDIWVLDEPLTGLDLAGSLWPSRWCASMRIKEILFSFLNPCLGGGRAACDKVAILKKREIDFLMNDWRTKGQHPEQSLKPSILGLAGRREEVSPDAHKAIKLVDINILTPFSRPAAAVPQDASQESWCRKVTYSEDYPHVSDFRTGLSLSFRFDGAPEPIGW